MNLLNPGVQQLSIQGNDEVVVIDGNNLSPNSTLEAEQLTRGTNARGGVNHLNKKWEMNLQHADSVGNSSLKDLPKQRAYQATVLGLNGFTFWQEDQAFQVDESALFDPESEDYPYVVRMSHISENPDIRQVLNALAPIASSDDEFYDGFDIVGSPTGSVSNGSQSLTSGVDAYIYRRLTLPFPGLTLKFSFDIETLHATADNQRYIVFRDVSGDVISNDTGTYTTTGIKTREFTLPANVYSVDVGAGFAHDGSSGTMTFSKLSVQLRSFDFVNY